MFYFAYGMVKISNKLISIGRVSKQSGLHIYAAQCFLSIICHATMEHRPKYMPWFPLRISYNKSLMTADLTEYWYCNILLINAPAPGSKSMYTISMSLGLFMLRLSNDFNCVIQIDKTINAFQRRKRIT